MFIPPTGFSGTGTTTGGCIGGTSYTSVGIGDILGGTVGVSGTCLTGASAAIEWSDFLVPSWPYGTVIKAIYPVLYVSSSESGPASDNWMSINGSGFIGSPTLAAGQVSVPHTSDSMGDTESVITSATVGASVDNTGVSEGATDIVINGIALAVYIILGKVTPTSVWINVGNTKPLGS